MDITTSTELGSKGKKYSCIIWCSKSYFSLTLPSKNSGPLTAIAILMPMLIVCDVIALFLNRKHFEYKILWSIAPYSLLGVIIGTILFKFINLSMISIFIGSILGLILAYFIRFFSLSFNGIKSSYEKINNSIDESAYLLGYSKIKTFLKIHIPYLKTNIILIMLLISLEVIKELPITLILRPFNFETFATQAYIYA